MKQNEDRAAEIATILCPCAECSSYETRYEAIAAALNSQSEIIREIEAEYAGKLADERHRNQELEAEIETNRRISRGNITMYQDVIDQYKSELLKKDEEIARLKGRPHICGQPDSCCDGMCMDLAEAIIALEKENSALKEEIARLRQFAEFVLESYCWDDCAEPDGGDLQEKAEELQLIELRPVNPDDNEYGENELYFPVWFEKKALTSLPPEEKGQNEKT